MATRDRPRLLLITRNLPPLVGGMERLNWHMARELATFADVRVVGPAGSRVTAPCGVDVHEVPLTPLPLFLASSLSAAWNEARQWRPDIVLAGSGLTAPAAFLAAKACSARTAAYVHGLDVIAPNPAYRAVWRPVLRRMNRVIANSRSTASFCRDIGIAPGDIGIVHPGVEFPDGVPDEAELAKFRGTHGLDGYRVLLSVGRLTERKGLREFVSHALPRIVASQPDALLLVVGDAPVDALHARAQSASSIVEAAERAGVSGHVRCVGRLSESELQAAYEIAQVHVFPIRELHGDPEGFGMVAVEAAARGLPTIAFDVGGVGDAVSDARSGYLVPASDYQAFGDAVCRVLGGALNATGCTDFARTFDWPLFGQGLARELGWLPQPEGIAR